MQIISANEAKDVFFKVLATTDKSQTAVMTLKPGADSGQGDLHAGDQVVYVIEGELRLVVGEEEGHATAGDIAVIPVGAKHRLYNDSKTESAFFISFYSSPEY